MHFYEMFNRFIKLLLTSVFESKHNTYHLPSKTVRHYITPLIFFQCTKGPIIYFIEGRSPSRLKT